MLLAMMKKKTLKLKKKIIKIKKMQKQGRKVI